MAVVWNTDVQTLKDGKLVTVFKTGDPYNATEAKKYFTDEELDELKQFRGYLDERRLPLDSRINPKAVDEEDEE